MPTITERTGLLGRTAFMVLMLFLATGPDRAVCDSSPAVKEVRVGCEIDFRPYSFVDEGGRPTGFGIDLIRAVADTMNLKVSIIPSTWDTAWKGLREGRLDVLPVVAKLPSRVNLVDFSIPHTETFDAFFVRKGAPAIRDISGARGKSVIVMRSDAAHHALMERNFEGTVVPVDTISEMFGLFASGKHDALLCPKLLGTLEIRNRGIKGLTAGPPIPDYKRVFSFAVKNGDHELLEKLNQGLLIVKTNREYDRIYEKWLSTDDPWLKYKKHFMPAIIAATGIALFAGLWAAVLRVQVRNRTRELAESNEMLRSARAELEDRVAQRTSELSEVNRSLQNEIVIRTRAEADLQRLNDDLEQRVRVRTSELSVLNDDLEQEVIERRKAEEELTRLNTLYSVLTRVNEAIVRINDPEQLFRQTCRIAVDSGLFRMAWIGLVDPGTLKVRPVASAGDNGRYLENITIMAGDVPEGRGPTGRAIREGRHIISGDIANDPAMALWRDSALKHGFRSSAAIPLRIGTEVVGAFMAYADKPHLFGDREVGLLSSLVDDLSFAIESISGEKKRIEAEQALLESSQEIRDLYNNSPCGYHSIDRYGVIVRMNDTELSWLGYSREEVIGRKITEFYSEDSSKRFILSYPEFIREGYVSNLELEFVRRDGTIMPVMVSASAVYGSDGEFLMTRTTVFDMTEQKERQRESMAANEVLKLFSATTVRSDYLNSLAGLLETWCGCGAVGIRLLDENNDMPFVANRGFTREFLEKENCLALGEDYCACTRVIEGRTRREELDFVTMEGSFVCNDTSVLCSENMQGLYRQTCVREGYSSLAIIPVRYRDQILGVIHLADTQKQAFTEKITSFIERITPLVGEAVYRFNIEEELMVSGEQLRHLSAHLLTAREEERARIAREVHDELGQLLTAAGMEIASIRRHDAIPESDRQRLLAASELIDSAINDIQKICSELRPRVLDHLGIRAAIEWEVNKFSGRTGIKSVVGVSDASAGLSGLISTALFRIVQEALTNVARHSGATSVSVQMELKDGAVILDISDNGKGIVREKILAAESYGIMGMRERVRELGGEVTFTGVRRKGTTITVRIPLKEEVGDV